MNKYYVAYGSNLNLKEMMNRCKSTQVVGTTILKDFRLVYKGGSSGFSYLTLEPSKGDFVPLGIYKIKDEDEMKLDIYEGYPQLYYKQYIDININGKINKALIYIMYEKYDYYIPSQDYVEICEEGYRNFGFDKQILNAAYINTIKNIENNELINKM